MNLDAWLDHQLQLHPKSIELGLDRVRPVAEQLGVLRPATRVVTVAGTNGKGSTVALLEAAALAVGWKVGAYTSPHIERYNERVRLHGLDATDAQLIAAFEAIEAARGDIALTYFEFGTLAALWLFTRAKLDLAILEVGLGGRLDAVNLVDADIAIVTTIDLDHMEWLGPTREHIGREKAGIFRAGRAAILGELDPPASVIETANTVGARLYRRGHEFDIEVGRDALRYRDSAGELALPRPQLQAPAQLDNAATAACALRLLSVPAAAIATGIASAAARARLQTVATAPEIVLDVGHNPQAARQLAEFLATHPKLTVAVFAALADKDVESVAQLLAPHISRWWLAGLDAGARSQSAQRLAARMQAAVPQAELEIRADVATALHSALGAVSADQRVLVFGSFHTIAEALAALRADGILRA
jgi:dihydrofolate synthase/folylpolyglutamate synthase